jgi:hypothetical protein
VREYEPTERMNTEDPRKDGMTNIKAVDGKG